MEVIEIVFKIIHIILFSCGISCNAILIYLSIFKTPKAIRTYSVLILNHAITDFVACMADFYTQVRLIPTDWTIAFVSNGPCQYISSWSCILGWSLQLHCFSHSLYLILICFTYRYLIIIRKVPSIKGLLLMVFVAYSPSFLQAVFSTIGNSSSQVIEQVVKKRHPYYNLDGLTFNGYISMFDPMTAYSVVNVTLSPTPIYVGVLIFRKKIIHVLEKTASHMREQTREMHKQLLKALTVQASIPLLNLLAVAVYFTGQLDIYHHPFLEYFNLTVVQVVPAITPIVSFVYIRPYRHVILCFFHKHVSRKLRMGTYQKESTFRETTYNAPERLLSSGYI